MRIKKIIAENLSEGKILIKKELGEDAVILSTRNIKNSETGKDTIEIVAAIDEKVQNIPKVESKSKGKISDIDKNKIDYLIESINYPFLSYLDKNLSNKYVYLKNLGFDETFIGPTLQSLSKTNNLDLSDNDLLNTIISRIKVENLFQKRLSRKVYGFVGPAGVGKSSTLLKFGVIHKIMNSSNVLVIGANNHNFGANDLLAAYCKLLDLNYEKAGSEEELNRLIDTKKAYDMILIDFDSNSKYTNSSLENILILPVNGDSNYLYNQLNEYSSSYIGLSGLDQKYNIQPILELLINRNLTLCFYTNGSNIPDDIELADVSGIKKMILSNG